VFIYSIRLERFLISVGVFLHKVVLRFAALPLAILRTAIESHWLSSLSYGYASLPLFEIHPT